MMNKKINLIVLLCVSTSMYAGDFLKVVTEKLKPADMLLELGLKEKQDRLVQLQKEKEEFERTKNLIEQNIATRLATFDRQLIQVRTNLSSTTDNQFLLKKQSILNEHYQILKDIRQERTQLAEIRNEYIKQLEEYLHDPTCEAFKKEQKVEELSYYPFEYLQELDLKVLEQQKKLNTLQEQEKNALEALKNRERIITAVTDAYKKKKEELEQRSPSNVVETLGYTSRQKTDLFVLEGNSYKDRIVLEEIKLKEAGYKVAIVRIMNLITKLQLDILKGVYNRIKPFVRVTENDLSYDEQELARKRQHYFAATEAYRADIEKIETHQSELEQLSKQAQISLGADLDDWSKSAQKSLEGYEALVVVGTLNERALLAQRERDYFETQIAFEKETFSCDSIQLESKQTFHRITARKFQSETEISDELKKYATLKADASANRAGYISKRDAMISLIEQRKKSLENLKSKKRDLENNAESIFHGHGAKYNALMRAFEFVDEIIKRQIRILDHTVQIYNAVIAKVDSELQRIEFITSELESIKFWYRPEHAISWQDVQTVLPDIERFLHDTYTYVARTPLKTWGTHFGHMVGYDHAYLWLLLKLVLFVLAMLAIKFYAPSVARTLVSTRGAPNRGIRKCGLFLEMLAQFYDHHFISITTWACAVFLGICCAIPEPYFYVLFYLISIPLFLYLVHSFVRHCISFNMQHDYVFISADFSERFFGVLSMLLYATIILLFFRAAFERGNYPQSEVPTVLLALNMILLQLALILWISKDRFLTLIPSRGGIWDWIYAQVDKYYYFLLIFFIIIIILINPFVGFGRLVRYILLRIVYTILVLQCILWLHDFIKRTSSTFFFQTRDETVKERFVYAKTWYGLFVVISLFVFMAVALILIAKLWSWPEALAKITSWEDVKSWLTTPIMLKDTDHPLSFLSLGQLIAFISGGLLISLSLDRFVLNRIFDVLLVEPGVQHAVSSITRYLIIVVALFLGIQFVGLGPQVWYLLAAFAFGLGWVIKDPVFDFIAYFIILVQRPIKIGDYIRFDDETRGIIRRITPRTVILRRKNSTTIIVPNSQVLNRAVTNLNYQIGFVVLDDIFVNISYNEDPAVVRETLMTALKSSPYILKNPQPIVRLHRFGAYGYVFLARGYVSSSYTLDIWNITGEIRLLIAQALKKNNIKIAIPLRIMPENLASSSAETLAGTPPEMSETRSDSE